MSSFALICLLFAVYVILVTQMHAASELMSGEIRWIRPAMSTLGSAGSTAGLFALIWIGYAHAWWWPIPIFLITVVLMGLLKMSGGDKKPVVLSMGLFALVGAPAAGIALFMIL